MQSPAMSASVEVLRWDTAARVRPARMNLTRAIRAGRIRNALEVSPHGDMWSNSSTVLPMLRQRGSCRSQEGARREMSRSKSPVFDRRSGRISIGSGIISPCRSSPPPPSSWLLTLRTHRLDLPPYLNAPGRLPLGSQLSPELKNIFLSRISDLRILLAACRRGGRRKEEGRATFSIGVLYDNLQQPKQALMSYKEFLKTCSECNDVVGAALACHCIGVDYSLMADESTSKSGELRKRAIAYHTKHLESGGETIGRFVAHLNLGVAHRDIGENDAASRHFDAAMRLAGSCRSIDGEGLVASSVALADRHVEVNEGSNPSTKALLEKFLSVSARLSEPPGQSAAYQKLGLLADHEGEYSRSREYFEKALGSAVRCHDAVRDHGRGDERHDKRDERDDKSRPNGLRE